MIKKNRKSLYSRSNASKEIEDLLQPLKFKIHTIPKKDLILNCRSYRYNLKEGHEKIAKPESKERKAQHSKELEIEGIKTSNYNSRHSIYWK